MPSRSAESEGKDTGLARFVRDLFFDLQTIDGVKPLEIWNGIRESDDQLEIANLVKNLYKIALPIVNETCAGRRFEVHGERARRTVEEVLGYFLEAPEARLFERFPDPPTGEPGQKELYRLVKELTRQTAAGLHEQDALAEKSATGLGTSVFPDGLFDFREMRVVDNELPFIIFTDKEFRVIHGLAVVYSWLIDLDGIFLQTLEKHHAAPEFLEEYRRFSGQVHAENPLVSAGRKIDTHELIQAISEKLKHQDYLDLFEGVYRWFEQLKARA